MKGNDFENQMRKFECFHNLQLLPQTWTVVRVDGQAFSKFTKDYEKPFDVNFHTAMTSTTNFLVEKLGGIYGYTESDEISILFKPEWELYDRSVEKIVSSSAAAASACFSRAVDKIATFDSRVISLPNVDKVVDYFRWRQEDAARCALNGWSYWTLRKEGMSARAATSILNNKGVDFKNELLFERGINFNALPN
jgi:tRNA(His) 5'-end guanylyltransferase